MKTVEQIRIQIKGCEYFIQSYRQQIEFHMNDDFDIDKIEEYSRKIKLLENEIRAFKWVIEDEL